METPLSSTRRVTRSQTSAAANNNIPWSRKIEEPEKGVSKSRQTNGNQEDRLALNDITNDSPIGGLAMGSLENPSSALSKKISNSRAKHNTPGSGEALLRGQVKTLLQKVEEEAELSKLSLENRPFLHLQGLVNSPLGLLAPTPANTPDLLNLSSSEESFKNNCLASVMLMPSPDQEQIKISETVTDIFDGEKQEGLESEKSLITRSLLLDFSEKSEGSDSSEFSSVLTHKRGDGGESESKEKSSTDDDDASVWSIQVNASTREDDDEEEEEGIEEIEKEDDEDYDDYEGEEEGEDGLLDELCEGISKISVNVAKFTGKHTRFVYNSDDELEGAEECGGEREAASPGILRLKGLPTPKGKHLRFPVELEREEE
ncbi:hypothetical protein F0562_006885 [Nyssa sinensis]|uniref:Uncharacterized protein n=1 Tax=Nyssa sinensis TaxID=561372 RepID=A0A5J5ALW1_9ASTE|nr:hypothetical protein F0562_006885 [Nyssa sinensis]